MGFLLDSLDETKFKRAARHREERAPPELRQPAVRPRRRDHQRSRCIRTGIRIRGPSIGSMADLTGASVEDVKRFFRSTTRRTTRRSSSSATSITAQTKAWIAKYFADLPRGQGDRATEVRIGRAAERKAIDVRGSRAGSAAHDSLADRRAGTATTQPALDVLADILAGSRIARLTKALVYDKQSAANVNALPEPGRRRRRVRRHRDAAARTHAHRARDADRFDPRRGSSATARPPTSSSARRPASSCAFLNGLAVEPRQGVRSSRTIRRSINDPSHTFRGRLSATSRR